MSDTRYPAFTVSGSPRQMGEQLGEAYAEFIRGFCEVALTRLSDTMHVDSETARKLSEKTIPLAEDYQPEFVEELRGMADATSLPLWKMMFLQIRNQFTHQADSGCTSLSLPANAERGPLVAQNWDSDPALDPFTLVLTRKPTDRPACMTVTQAGLIAYIGLNDRGMAACLNTLPAPSRAEGVPHYFTLRSLYETSSLSEAKRTIQRAERAIPANIMLTTPEGPANLEVTLKQVYTLKPQQRDWISHTNHCLHAETCQFNSEFPELIESHPRKERIDQLLSEQSANISIKDIQVALSNHTDYPRSICRHTNDDEQTGYWQTVFSVIIDSQRLQMHITRGTPCQAPYETYNLQ